VVERNLAKVEVARSNRVTRFKQSKTFKADGFPSAFLFCRKPLADRPHIPVSSCGQRILKLY
jgi:hypothetical protein